MRTLLARGSLKQYDEEIKYIRKRRINYEDFSCY